MSNAFLLLSSPSNLGYEGRRKCYRSIFDVMKQNDILMMMIIGKYRVMHNLDDEYTVGFWIVKEIPLLKAQCLHISWAGNGAVLNSATT